MVGITDETTELLEKTNRLASDIEHKTKKLDPLFDGVKGIGETVQDFNASMQDLSANLSKGAKSQEAAGKAVKWGKIGRASCRERGSASLAGSYVMVGRR